MRKKLHPVVLTVAILQVVFGVFGMCCGGFSVLNGVGLYMAPEFNSPAPPQTSLPKKQPGSPQPKTVGDDFNRGYQVGVATQVELIQKVPGYRPFKVADALFSLFLVLLMVVSGIGLFWMQSWARWLAVGYAVLSIFSGCVGLGYHLLAVMPVLSSFRDRLVQEGVMGVDEALVSARFLPFGGCLLSLYPVLVLLLLLIPPVHRAFRGEPVADTPGDDFRDREDYRDRYRGSDRFR